MTNKQKRFETETEKKEKERKWRIQVERIKRDGHIERDTNRVAYKSKKE